MHHAPITRCAALTLGAVMLLAACDGSGNGPASPRTSEVVHLSQAPVDAVPYVASRPAGPAPKPTTEATKDEALTEQAQAEIKVAAPTTAASSATVAANTAAPVAVPSRPEPTQPQPTGDVPQN